MTFSAIARIEHYKHYQMGAIHKEATRELTNYKNPNWDKERTQDNIYFERMELDKPIEQWIYDYREQNNIVGRYIEHSKNPKSETNAMCQAFFTVPGYIDSLDRDEQIRVLEHCYNFFKEEFPEAPVLEAVCHFDETSPHLQINFLPVVEREHKKRGKEKIFSTTLLMNGPDYFIKYQDRFFSYMQDKLSIDLERKKGSKAKHLSPKEYREVTAELAALEEERDFLIDNIEEIKKDNNLDRTISLYDRIRALEYENKKFRSFLGMIFKKLPKLQDIFRDFSIKFDNLQNKGIDKGV